MSVTISTSIGNLRVTLFTEERPRCCLNFLKLCKMKYYNFCLFHFIKRNFVAQTGDPTGTGSGGVSIFKFLYGDVGKYFEWEQSPRIQHKAQGLLSMINNGNNFHGSQFMITLASSLVSLDGKHSVFGSVVPEDFPTLSLLNDTMTGDDGIPYRDVRILHTWVTEDPFDDLPGIPFPPMSPEVNEAALVETGRIRFDEEVDPAAEVTLEELERKKENHEGEINAEILTMIGDIPTADVKPPDNILFVCKLNPLTGDEDLEVIFSRFGKILSCEVIRDWNTGKSLQFAFIEFENVSACEDAFLRMDNALIDDRRIHVDFSQSVSKMRESWMDLRGKSGETSAGGDDKAKEKELLALSDEFSLNVRHERFKNDDFIFEEEVKKEVESDEEVLGRDVKEEFIEGGLRGVGLTRDPDEGRNRRDRVKEEFEGRHRRDRVKEEFEGRHRRDRVEDQFEGRHRRDRDEGMCSRRDRRESSCDGGRRRREREEIRSARCHKHKDSSRNCKKMANCERCKRRDKYGH